MQKIYLDNGEYVYHGDSNTLLNSQIRDLYEKECRKREINKIKLIVDKKKITDNLKYLKQVTFEITQDCNMKCKYCIYSSGEYNRWRKESPAFISAETARRVIDYLRKIIGQRESKKFTVGFFGGEPLLRFNVIKEITDYTREVFQGWDILFTITTNGVLLTKPITRYFIDNKFSIFASLDGNQPNHDAKRTYPDGKGSFKTLMKNLSNIKEMDREYYINNVSFSIVYSKDLPWEGVLDFFKNEELVKENDVSFNFVNSLDTTYYENFLVDTSIFETKFNTSLKAIIEKKKNREELSSIERNIFAKLSVLNEMLQRRTFSSLMGACFFNSKLFVDAAGKFHICEKMNDKFPLGDSENGFNLAAMKRIASQYVQFMESKCVDCSVYYLCQRCYIHFAGDGEFKMNSQFCRNQQTSIKRMIEDVITVNRFGGFE
ncbi:MAG: uncharacterized protein QG657_235 [Acidobacteriota bacterium]|nr:uncharacterized protein [Acidobacteriota bacterium]